MTFGTGGEGPRLLDRRFLQVSLRLPARSGDSWLGVELLVHWYPYPFPGVEGMEQETTETGEDGLGEASVRERRPS